MVAVLALSILIAIHGVILRSNARRARPLLATVRPSLQRPGDGQLPRSAVRIVVADACPPPIELAAYRARRAHPAGTSSAARVRSHP